MIVHKRQLSGAILCSLAGPSRQNVISSSRDERVTCEDCRFRLGGGGDAAGVSTSCEAAPPAPLAL